MKNFSTRIMGVFSEMNTDYEGMNNLMQDLALGREIYDEESQRVISKAEANATVLDFSRKVLGIKDIKDSKAVRRAIRDNGREWLDIIEDTVDAAIELGLQQGDFFNMLVDSRNIRFGDRQDFYIDKETFLSVAKGGVSHHDHIIQTIAPGSVVSIPTCLYVVKVGADINKYVLGQIDWVKLIQAIAKAYQNQILEEVYGEVSSAAASLPVTSGFVGTGALDSTNKDNFDAIIENVSAANGGVDVVILGTKSGLAKINALADVYWGAASQKQSVAETGNIGLYEGTRLVTIPNRFTDATLTNKIFNSNILLILPMIGDDGKFVKLVDEGDTIILEKMERGDYVSDIQTYEVQRRIGVGTVIGRQFGQWTITAAQQGGGGTG